METTTKTRLQAFIEAQETGQIAITQRTAKILENMMRLEDIVDTLCDNLSDGYPGEAQDKIKDRIYSGYAQLSNAIYGEFADYLAMFSLCNIEFTGL